MAENSEKLEIPEILTNEFFKKSLENGLKLTNVNIEKFDLTLGSSGGENYCSQIYRARIKYNHENMKGGSQNISLIVKYMIMTGEREFLEEMQVYQREIKMYSEVIPAMEKLLGNNIKLAPKCFYYVDKPVTTIVFEDMNESGFKIADRINGLDECHTKILLEKIAKFHAASMVLAKKEPKLIKSFDRSFFHSPESVAKDMIFIGNLEYLADMIKKQWPNFETIAKKIRYIKENFYEIALKSVTHNEKTISVLNHGDLWVNNMMFKRNNKNVLDVSLIDLQISYYGSLGIDLHYFLNSSVPTDLLITKRYELLRHYFCNLKSTLEQLKYEKIPSWEEFKNDIRATEFYGFIAFESVLPIIQLEREKSKNNSFEKLADEEQCRINREAAFNSKRMLEMTKYALDRFDELGVLDVKK